jgi:energy-coupling factor transport system ATP-binding protein
VLDEPTSFLDPVAAHNFFEVVSMLNRELGLTIILVEHRLDLLAPYASRVIIMDGGKIVADDAPRKVFMSKQIDALGVGLPKVTRLFHLLVEQGLDLAGPPLSVRELSDELRRRLANDRG